MKSKSDDQVKKYDLEARAETFSVRVRDFCAKLKKDIINVDYIRQLLKSAGSVPANYIEANESLGDQDKKMHIKISRKEAKESKLWLRHVLTYGNTDLEKERETLVQEAHELESIFGSIYRKLEANAT